MPIDTDGLIAADLSPDDASLVMREFGSVGLSADLPETPSRQSLQGMAWVSPFTVETSALRE
jgi:hypothetical protein